MKSAPVERTLIVFATLDTIMAVHRRSSERPRRVEHPEHIAALVEGYYAGQLHRHNAEPMTTSSACSTTHPSER